MNEFYNNNKRFKEYVDKYCFKHEISLQVALTHESVRLAYLYIKETS